MNAAAPGTPPDARHPGPKGPWLSRLAIHVLTAVVGVLIYWLLGFLVDDIGSVQGPAYEEIEKRHLEPELVERDKALTGQITEAKRLVDKQKQKQELLAQSSQGLQQTMGQLLELQKLGFEKNLAASDDQTKAFSDSLAVFLSNQDRFQAINEEVATLVEKQQSLEDEQAQLRGELDKQRRPALEEHRLLTERHRSRLAILKLVVLVPLFAAGIWLVLKMRGRAYFPLYLAFAGAISIKMLVVMHEHFPQRWFKYILVVISLLAAGRLLVYFIRSVVAPKRDKLLRQYRDAYEKFLCPVCEYPIRRGPMKYLYWNRRTLKSLRPAAALAGTEPAEEAYTCPACSTRLFGECRSCHRIRPTLLPFCDRCGAPDGALEA